MSFHIFLHRGRPVIAVPLNYNIRILRASVAALPAFTLKRKLFKIYAYWLAFVLMILHRWGVFGGSTLPPFEKSLVQRIQDVCPNAEAVVPIWSLVPGRPRSYYRVFDRNAVEIAFAKVSASGVGVVAGGR